MPKDRNSMAKRQRETDKQRRAQEKKDRRDQRKTAPEEEAASLNPHIQLTPDEVDVLQTFAQFLMPPDQMLCLNNTELPATKRALEKLIGRGLLISNDFKSGYSLTVEGFDAMQRLRTS